MALITYTVQAGDNLTNIAARFDTTVQELQDANGIQNPNLIYIGQVLVIPGDDLPDNLAIRTIEQRVRLRKKPKFEDNVIVFLMKGTMFYNASLKGDWWEVQYQGNSAYIHASMVETYIPDPKHIPQPNEIIYRSQWDVDAGNRVNDCGQTCVAMLAGSRGVSVSINDLPYQSAPSGISNANDLVKNFEHLALTTAEVKHIPVDSPTPEDSICLIWYGGLNRDSVQDKNFTGWHWVVFLREEDNDVIVHDPDFWGDRRDEGSEKHYSTAEWEAAFIPYGSNFTSTCVVLN